MSLSLVAITLSLLSTAGGFDTRPRLVQTSHFDGTTAVGLTPRITFHGRNADDDLAKTLVERLAEQSEFLSDAGERVAAEAYIDTSERGGWTFAIQLVPVRPLQRDTWYTLAIQKELAFVVGTAEASEADEAGVIRVRLYTGSAPRIRRLVASDDPNKPVQTLDVVLSEPVALGTLSDSLSVKVDGADLPGCVAWEGSCVDAGRRSVRTDALTFVLAQPRKGPGFGRSATKVRALGKELAVPSSAWRACPGGADARCVHLGR